MNNLCAAAILFALACSDAGHAGEATAERAMVATVHPLATDTAIEVLKQGGNAVDAAIAAALTLGVVDNHNSGLGGGCFILLRLADGRLVAIDGRETAPAKATRDMFLRDGQPQPTLSQTGPLASGVPGALAAYALANRQYGQLKFSSLLAPAAQIAEQGFAIDPIYARNLSEAAGDLARFPTARATLLKADGSPYHQGEVLRQPDLARTYRAIAKRGTDWFYRGPFAQRVGQWMQASGGILAADDFASYRALVRSPLVTTYRGYTIVGFPPPSSGGVHVAQILNMLESFDVQSVFRQSTADFTHLVIEAMKLAFADRAFWLGDADFSPVPRGLVDKQYAAELARRIDFAQAARVPSHSTPPNAQRDVFGMHTTHIAAADAQGNWAAITTTINGPFGSEVIVPGTGVLLNNQMDDFSIFPGVPNAYGLVGAEANSIAPGKRPLSSMSPTIVLKDGRPTLTVGAAGGPLIISQTLLTIVRRLDLNWTLPETLAARRFHHQWTPDHVRVEQGFDPKLIAELERRGHVFQSSSDMAIVQAIERSCGGNSFLGVHDPRVPGKAAGLDGGSR